MDKADEGLVVEDDHNDKDEHDQRDIKSSVVSSSSDPWHQEWVASWRDIVFSDHQSPSPSQSQALPS